MENKKYLLIDGNYFGHRVIHGIRIGQPDFNLTTSQQIFNFESSLNDSFINLFKSFNNNFHELIDNVIFVFDHKSWRKDIKYDGKHFKPYYISDAIELQHLGYKDNRKEDKEKSDIDWDNFNKSMSNFRMKIENIVATFNTDSSEGDDALFFLSQYFTNRDIDSIIFCTDGDLKSLINNNTMLLRNIKSNEFVISKFLNKKLFEPKNIIEQFTQVNTDTSFYDNLFSVDVSNGGTVKSRIVRIPGSGIEITDSTKNLIIKIICGDKKDNIFPIFRWKASTGKMNKKVTENMIIKAFEIFGYDWNEENCVTVFNDNKMMSMMLFELQKITKQKDAPMREVGAHYKHNLLLNKLSFETIPEFVIKNLENRVTEIIDLIDKNLKIEEILKIRLNVTTSDNAKDLIITSTPKNNGEGFIDICKQSESNNSIVNDILNS